MSRNFDRAVRDANDSGDLDPITLTVSAGNQSQQAPKYATCTDRRLSLPPATAKNAISVGGAESVRSTAEQWSCLSARADRFENIQSNSKRGTLNAGWFKPDLMAPSSLIVVQRSSEILAGPLCSSAPFISSEYQVAVGTSFSAPAAAGAALLASRVYAESLQPNCRQNSTCSPGAASPALLKAMLIAGARSMRGGVDRAAAPPWQKDHTYSMGDVIQPTAGNGHLYRARNEGSSGSGEPDPWPTNSGGQVTNHSFVNIVWEEDGSTFIGAFPNGQQGFGRLHLEDVLNSYPARDYVNEPVPPLSSLQSWTRTYQVHDLSLPVKVVLTWTDEPALQNETDTSATTTNPLVNDLNLAVDLESPCTTRFIGNRTIVLDNTRGEESQGLLCTDVSYDTVNNVEMVKFFPTAATQFTVRVTAANVTVAGQKFALAAYNAFDTDVAKPAPPGTPGNFSTIGSPSQVLLSWSGSAGATSYEVQRKSDGGFFSTLATPAGTSYTDNSVSTNAGYLYRVRARNATGVSAWVNHFSTTTQFADNPLLAGTTVIRKIHIDELRTAVNRDRAAVGLPAFTFSETLTAQFSTVKASHVNELRMALDQARASAGMTSLIYTDGSLSPGSSTVKAVHVMELRNNIQ